MTREKILVMCLADANSDPRPNRMINCLKDLYSITVVGSADYKDPVVESVLINAERRGIWKKLKYLFQNILGLYEQSLDLNKYLPVIENLRNTDYAAIITHDLVFLSLLKKYNKNAKVILDAREYYPRQYEDKLVWRLVYSRMYDYFCRHYLKVADVCITVSDGLASEYQKIYGMQFDVLPSWPAFYSLSPSPVDESRIRIIHHGNALSSRKIEKMIEMMTYVNDRFTLDLMLVNRDRQYYEKLQRLVAGVNNVNIIDPVPFEEIVPFSNQYDIGLYLTEPASFNVRHMLPNKFFEFIQSRLMIAIGPSIEMMALVNRHELGVVADNFDPQSLANMLNRLSASQIEACKNNSNKLAHEFNAENNCKMVRTTLSNLLDAGSKS